MDDDNEMPPARVCRRSLHGAETSFQLTLALLILNCCLFVCLSVAKEAEIKC